MIPYTCSVLQFIQIRDPLLLMDTADAHPSRTLVVLGSEDPKRRRFEGRDVKRYAGKAGFFADYSARHRGWIINRV